MCFLVSFGIEMDGTSILALHVVCRIDSGVKNHAVNFVRKHCCKCLTQECTVRHA